MGYKSCQSLYLNLSTLCVGVSTGHDKSIPQGVSLLNCHTTWNAIDLSLNGNQCDIYLYDQKCNEHSVALITL